MPWTPPPEEQLRLLGRAHRMSNAVLTSFGLVVVFAIVAIVNEPSRWWLFAIGIVLAASAGGRTLRRRRKIGAAQSRIEAEQHQAHTSAATPEGR